MFIQREQGPGTATDAGEMFLERLQKEEHVVKIKCTQFDLKN